MMEFKDKKVLVLVPNSEQASNVPCDLVYGCWCAGKRIGGIKFPPLTSVLIATIFFRLFNIFLERFTIIHRWFDRYLKLKKVKVNPSAKGRLDREIILREGEVRLTDEIKGIDIEKGVNHRL